MDSHDIEKTTETLQESGAIQFFSDYYSQLKNAIILSVGDIPSDNGPFASMKVRLESESIERLLILVDKFDTKKPGDVIFLGSELDKDGLDPDDFVNAKIIQVMLATNPIPGKAIGDATLALNIERAIGGTFIVGMAGGESNECFTPGVLLGLPIPVL